MIRFFFFFGGGGYVYHVAVVRLKGLYAFKPSRINLASSTGGCLDVSFVEIGSFL